MDVSVDGTVSVYRINMDSEHLKGFKFHFRNHKMSLEKEAEQLFGEMRDATPEEQQAVRDYIKSISTMTGVNYYDLLKGD